MLAITEGNRLLFRQGKFHRAHAGAFVGTIAVRLRLGLATGAPPVITSSEFEDGGFAIVNDFFFHSPASCTHQ